MPYTNQAFQSDESTKTREAWVVTNATSKAAELLGITNTVLAKVLGISEASISRLRAGKYVLDRNGKPFEMAVLFIRIFRSLDAICGGEESVARSWLVTENLALLATPLSLMQTASGLVQVLQYVDASRARI